MTTRFIIGIDEVGRGPLAGPVSVGIAVVPSVFSLAGLKDSKVMTPPARERIYKEACALRRAGNIKFGVYSVSATYIDRHGIAPAIRECIRRGLAALRLPLSAALYLDGGLVAPAQFKNQQTIIRGDASVPAISLASVVAKVERDRYMALMHSRHAHYHFDQNKGYGTAAHIAAIEERGLSPLHRRTFCKNMVFSMHD